LARILKISADVLYFYAQRLPQNIRGNADVECIIAAYRAFRETLGANGDPSTKNRGVESFE
jgi:hypothetical protein